MSIAKPSLQVNFARAKKLDARFSFGRTSTATYVDANGIIKSAVEHEPRFDHNPTTGESLGLLLEPASTNMCERSEEFDNASWAKTNMLAFGSGSVANATTAPNDTTTADLLVPNTTGAVHHHVQNNDTAGSYTDGEYVTASVFVKPAGYYRLSLLMYYAAGSTGGIGAHFDLTTGTWISSQNSPYAYSITPYPNGWFRITTTAIVTEAVTYPATLLIRILIRQPTGTITATWAGDGTSGMYMWGGQLEKSSFPTSYIPTPGATAVTRTTDTLNMYDIGSWYNPMQGTFIGEMQSMHIADTEGETIRYLSVGDSSGSVLYRLDDAAGYNSDDGSTLVGGPSPTNYNDVFRWAMSYGDSVRDLCVNSSLATTGALVPSGFGKMDGGLWFALGNRQGQRIKSLTYVPERIERQELVRLTSSAPDSYTPSMVLNFTGSDTIDSRLTFTRASIGTCFDKNGLLVEVPANTARIEYDPVTREPLGLLMERPEDNFLLYSERMYGTGAVNTTDWSWATSGGNVSSLVRAAGNAIEAPDGSVHATKIVSGNDGSAKYHHWAQNVAVTERADAHTFSCFVKAGEYIQVALRIIAGTKAASGAWEGTAIFSLESNGSGTVLSTGGNYYLSSGIKHVGNGWYKCWVSCSQIGTVAGAGTVSVAVSPAQASTDFITGNGYSGLYVWGANLSQAPIATSYIPSTMSFTSRAGSATYYGSDGLIKSASTNVVRMDYNPSNLTAAPKMLLEQQVTNELIQSHGNTSAWGTITATTITDNQAVSPDGTTTAPSIVEDITDATHQISKVAATTFTAGNSYTFSMYVKDLSGDRYPSLLFGSAAFTAVSGAIFNIRQGTVVSTQGTSTTTASIKHVGNGWFRCSISAIATTTATAGVFFRILSTDQATPSNHVGNGTSGFYIWGIQREIGVKETSYIPTTTAVAQRVADVSSSTSYSRAVDSAKISGTNFTDFYNKYEGTLLVKYSMPIAPAVPYAENNILTITDADETDMIRMRVNNSTQKFVGTIRTNDVVSGTTPTSLNATKFGDRNYTAMSWTSTTVNASTNGEPTGTTTLTSGLPTTALIQMDIGRQPVTGQSLTGHIAQVSYIPEAVPTDILQKLSRC